jgi:hypothetical protein
LTIIGLQPALPAHAAQRCFVETNQCMDGRIAEFWEQNGGLAVFGYPIGPQEQTTVDGKTITVQRFERNRLELHPGNKRPYDVLLGRLGADRLGQQGRDWFGFAKSGDTGGCRLFAETGHAVCGAILTAWRANGLQIDGKKTVSEAESLALFGMPLSGLMTETLSDGKQYQVQWFERARFELHPENAAPYDVLLGLLGSEDFAYSQIPKPTPTPLPLGLSDTEIAARVVEMPKWGYWKASVGARHFEVGNFVYIPNYFYITPSPGNRFVLLSIQLNNKSDKSSYITPVKMVLFDTNGGQHIYAKHFRVIPYNPSFIIESGKFNYGLFCFEIPLTAAPERLIFHYDFSGNTVEVVFDKNVTY